MYIRFLLMEGFIFLAVDVFRPKKRVTIIMILIVRHVLFSR